MLALLSTFLNTKLAALRNIFTYAFKKRNVCTHDVHLFSNDCLQEFNSFERRENTLSFSAPHKAKSHRVRSGERGGHSVKLRRPIHSGNSLSRNARTFRA